MKHLNGGGFGANVLAYSTLTNFVVETPTSLVDRYPIDVALLSDHVTIDTIDVDRGSINISESGGFVTLSNFDLHYGRVSTWHKHNTTLQNGHIYRADKGETVLFAVLGNNNETENQTYNNIIIENVSDEMVCAVIGPDCIGHQITQCNFAGTATPGWATIRIYSTATDYLVSNNTVDGELLNEDTGGNGTVQNNTIL